MTSDLGPCDGSGNAVRWMRKFSRLNADADPASFLANFDSYLEGHAADWADENQEVKFILSVEGVRKATAYHVARLCELSQEHFDQARSDRDASRCELSNLTREPTDPENDRPAKRQRTLPPGADHRARDEDTVIPRSVWEHHRQQADETILHYALRTRETFAATNRTDRSSPGAFLDSEDQEHLERVINVFVSGIADEALRANVTEHAGSKCAIDWSLNDFTLHAAALGGWTEEGQSTRTQLPRTGRPWLHDRHVHVRAELIGQVEVRHGVDITPYGTEIDNREPRSPSATDQTPDTATPLLAYEPSHVERTYIDNRDPVAYRRTQNQLQLTQTQSQAAPELRQLSQPQPPMANTGRHRVPEQRLSGSVQGSRTRKSPAQDIYDHDSTDPESSDSDGDSHLGPLCADDKALVRDARHMQAITEPKISRNEAGYARDLVSPMREISEILSKSRVNLENKLYTIYTKRNFWSEQTYTGMQAILSKAKYPALSFLLLDMANKEQDILSLDNAHKIPAELVQTIRRIWHEQTSGGGTTKAWKTRFVPKHLSKTKFCFEFGKWDRGLLSHLLNAIDGTILFPVSERSFEYWELIMEYLIVANHPVFTIFDCHKFKYRSKKVKLKNSSHYSFQALNNPSGVSNCSPGLTLRVSRLPTGTTTDDLTEILPDGVDFYIPFAWKPAKNMQGCAIVQFADNATAWRYHEAARKGELLPKKIALTYCRQSMIPMGPLEWPKDL